MPLKETPPRSYEHYLQPEVFEVEDVQVTVAPTEKEFPEDSVNNPDFKTHYKVTFVQQSDGYHIGSIILENLTFLQRKALGYSIRINLKRSLDTKKILQNLKKFQ